MELDSRIQKAEFIGTMILASPVLIPRGSKPMRIVMYRLGSQFVVHKEILRSDSYARGLDERDSCRFIHDEFLDGNYFPFHSESQKGSVTSEIEARRKAEDKFKARSKLFFDFYSQ
jgi:hypothetical protein